MSTATNTPILRWISELKQLIQFHLTSWNEQLGRMTIRSLGWESSSSISPRGILETKYLSKTLKRRSSMESHRWFLNPTTSGSSTHLHKVLRVRHIRINTSSTDLVKNTHEFILWVRSTSNSPRVSDVHRDVIYGCNLYPNFAKTSKCTLLAERCSRILPSSFSLPDLWKDAFNYHILVNLFFFFFDLPSRYCTGDDGFWLPCFAEWLHGKWDPRCVSEFHLTPSRSRSRGLQVSGLLRFIRLQQNISKQKS